MQQTQHAEGLTFPYYSFNLVLEQVEKRASKFETMFQPLLVLSSANAAQSQSLVKYIMAQITPHQLGQVKGVNSNAQSKLVFGSGPGKDSSIANRNW